MRFSLRAFALLFAALLIAGSVRAQSFDDLGASATLLTDPTTEVRGKRAVMAYTADAPDASFTGVLVRGMSDDAEVTGAVRFAEGDGWTAWNPLRFTFSATDASFVAGFREESAVRSGRFQLRFEADRTARFDVAGAGTFDNREDSDALPVVDALIPHAVPQQVAGAAIPTPALIRRSSWGAEAFRGTPSPLARPNYLYLTFHHAAGYKAENASQGRVQMQRIQDLHQNTRGWSDVGYQFVVDRAGNLYQGRPFVDESQNLSDVPQLAMGAHVGGANTGNIGLSILGCYHPPEGITCEDEITPQALDAVVEMFAWLAQNYGLDGSNIRGHRDFSSTSCPGDNNYALLGTISDRVDAALRDGVVVVEERPTTITLDGAFPNPFSESTEVNYFLIGTPFNVRITVYDALGKEVAVLPVEDDPSEDGRWYTTSLDGTNLASGTYYVRLTSDDFNGQATSQTTSIVRVR